MGNNKPDKQLYVEQLCNDLKLAEKQLRRNIEYRGMSFSQSRLDDAQKNVDRLHELIRSVTSPTEATQERKDISDD